MSFLPLSASRGSDSRDALPFQMGLSGMAREYGRRVLLLLYVVIANVVLVATLVVVASVVPALRQLNWTGIVVTLIVGVLVVATIMALRFVKIRGRRLVDIRLPRPLWTSAIVIV